MRAEKQARTIYPGRASAQVEREKSARQLEKNISGKMKGVKEMFELSIALLLCSMCFIFLGAERKLADS